MGVSEDNSRKSKHGANAKKSLKKTVDDLKDFGAISDSIEAPSYGYKDYDPKQFDAHQEITYPDGSKAILYATSSLRSDRVEKDQWRAHNIKAIEPRVEYAFIVLPDESGYNQGTATRDAIREKRIFSAIDDIVTTSEFYNRTVADYASRLGSGASHDLQGRKLEDLFAGILSNKGNTERYNGSNVATGYMYDVFDSVLQKLHVKKGAVLAVRVTTDIPHLPSGGNPKTDVAASFELYDGTVLQRTFSLKNTSRNAVTVHEYSADQFADVLDPSNKELRRLLNVFQQGGNKEKMSSSDIEALTEALKPYLSRLNRWVLSGEGPDDVEPIQIAQYIVTHNKSNGRFGIHSINDYCEKLSVICDTSKWFGTIFSWTYPSKKRGSKIQLKVKII